MNLARVGRFFPRNDILDCVETKLHFDASPDSVWKGMLFYEELPGRPSSLLRMFLPAPVRTSGEKTRVGSIIECTYDKGYLEKIITTVERARTVRFDVLVQRLGVEDCISMQDGAYEIRPGVTGTDVALTTRYRGHLRPRWLWRPLERFLAHRLHRHILDGMRGMVEASESHQAPVLSMKS